MTDEPTRTSLRSDDFVTDDFVMEGTSRVDKQDRSFDIEYWQRQGSAARFAAAWDMVVFAYELKGGDASELRLERTVEYLERR